MSHTAAYIMLVCLLAFGLIVPRMIANARLKQFRRRNAAELLKVATIGTVKVIDANTEQCYAVFADCRLVDINVDDGTFSVIIERAKAS